MNSLFSNWKALLGLCVIFVLGCVAGVLVDRALVARKIRQALQNGPEAMAQVVQRRLTYDLSLDKVQQDKLRVILDDTAQKIKEARRQIQPQVRTILLEARKKTEAILTPEQQARFQQDLERARKRSGRIQFLSGGAADMTTPATPASTNAPSSQ